MCLFTASENCHDFHPMFFTHDRSFEEFFCNCIQLLNKTWKEMRATSEDFNKVRAALLIEILHLCLILHQSPSSSSSFAHSFLSYLSFVLFSHLLLTLVVNLYGFVIGQCYSVVMIPTFQQWITISVNLVKKP